MVHHLKFASFLLDAKENSKTYGRIFAGKLPGSDLRILPGMYVCECWASILIQRMFSLYAVSMKYFCSWTASWELVNTNEAVDVTGCQIHFEVSCLVYKKVLAF